MSRTWGRTAVTLFIALLFVLPVLWVVSAALHPLGRPLPTGLQLWPDDLTLANFGRIWTSLPMARYTLNSLLVVSTAVPLALLTGSWAGLGMARLPQASQRRWLLITLVVLMVPEMSLWSTRFLVYKWLGWLDSYWALIATAWMGGGPFFVLMFYRAFRRIPASVYDAARLDGAGVLQLWWLVALPMVRSTATAVALLTFFLYWGDFINPLLYLSRQRLFTLSVALQLLQAMPRADWPLLMAGTVWALFIPVLLFGIALFYSRRQQSL